MCEQLLGVRFEGSLAGEPAAWWDESPAASEPTRPSEAAAKPKAPGAQAEFSFSEALRVQEPAPGSEPVPEPPAPEAPVVRNELVEVEPLPERIVHRPRVRASVPQGETAEHTFAGHPATYAHRGQFRGMLSMGKYLTLNGTLDGNSTVARRFRLPRNGFVARLRLWNEPLHTVGSYQDLRFPPRELSSHGPRRADGNLLT
jgi:hypothetical protein